MVNSYREPLYVNKAKVYKFLIEMNPSERFFGFVVMLMMGSVELRIILPKNISVGVNVNS